MEGKIRGKGGSEGERERRDMRKGKKRPFVRILYIASRFNYRV